jgi:hypothetical protein
MSCSIYLIAAVWIPPRELVLGCSRALESPATRVSREDVEQSLRSFILFYFLVALS